MSLLGMLLSAGEKANDKSRFHVPWHADDSMLIDMWRTPKRSRVARYTDLILHVYILEIKNDTCRFHFTSRKVER